MKKYLLALLFLSFGLNAKEETPKIEPLTWVEEGFLSRQRDSVEEITKLEFGSRLHGNKSDLRLLQRIVDNEYINQTETQRQQALGIVLGDIFVKELGLKWVSYTDSDGKSRATCLPKTQYCLFPVTMLSKRMRLGVKPDVTEMYERGASLIEPYLPKLPYSAKK